MLVLNDTVLTAPLALRPTTPPASQHHPELQVACSRARSARTARRHLASRAQPPGRLAIARVRAQPAATRDAPIYCDKRS